MRICFDYCERIVILTLRGHNDKRRMAHLLKKFFTFLEAKKGHVCGGLPLERLSQGAVANHTELYAGQITHGTDKRSYAFFGRYAAIKQHIAVVGVAWGDFSHARHEIVKNGTFVSEIVVTLGMEVLKTLADKDVAVDVAIIVKQLLFLKHFKSTHPTVDEIVLITFEQAAWQSAEFQAVFAFVAASVKQR